MNQQMAASNPLIIARLHDGMSSTATLTTTASSFSGTSTVPGIGMVSGQLIKRLGQVTISVAANTRIRLRLHNIRNTVRKKSQDYWTLSNLEVQHIIEDLYELLQYASL